MNAYHVAMEKKFLNKNSEVGITKWDFLILCSHIINAIKGQIMSEKFLKFMS